MKRKLIVSACLVLTAQLNVAVAQMDSVATNAILTLILSKPVSEKIFVEYPNGRWNGAFDLPCGSYVFIPPNSILRAVYPTILNEMPYTTGTDGGLLNMRSMYRDSIRGIFITQIVGFELFTVFERIQIEGNTSEINFFTTSKDSMEQYEDRYISAKSRLTRMDNGWAIAQLKIKRIKWRDYFK